MPQPRLSTLPALREPLRIPDPTVRQSFWEKWTPQAHLSIFLYLCGCFIALSHIPNYIWDPDAQEFTYVIGIIGIWRYTWWFNHWVRALVYRVIAYPRVRDRAAEVWDAGWRPHHIHIQMTTFRENREISQAVIEALCREIRDAGVSATLWLGSSEASDEDKISRHLKLVGGDLDIELRIIRQNQPGKRVAIALILRAMSRAGLGPDDLVIFMDGDFILHAGAIRKCFPLFALDPQLHALTTDEHVLVRGPKWMQSWLDMRFAQRRLAMQSHALSDRVLTLTGRFSVFRATHIVSEEFIRLQEADYLTHWLWGTFRFLSGDDKSSWYTLLKQGVKMTYVPDAAGTTVEIVEGSGRQRMIENLRRWSGNMLRNGQRAIMLGPWRMPLFIWWCLVDQRLAIWTMLLSPMLAVAGTIKIGPGFLLAYVLYIAVSRMILAIVLFGYSRRVDLNYIWCLYGNQLLNAVVKVYMLWRLAKQKWANRGNQKAGLSGTGVLAIARNIMAIYLTTLTFAALLLIVVLYTEIMTVPSWSFVAAMISN